MRNILERNVPSDATIITGPKGGRFIISPNGTRIYLIKERKRHRVYKPRPGAFSRFVDAQINNVE